MELSLTEEDYLKAIYHLASPDFARGVSTNDIAHRIGISAASVSDMLRKLAQKHLLDHVKYQGVKLTDAGKQRALYIIRKHRLWETFLVEKLRYRWDEVHIIAEQLEHIDAPELINRLDEFLGFPALDPHGDPIPNARGEIMPQKRIILKNAPICEWLKIIAVEESSPKFLQHLDKIRLGIGSKIQLLAQSEFDGSFEIQDADQRFFMISQIVAENLYVIKG